jgi:L-ascorbate metabolism protein UlaG (beta-lactamase superfamily)
LRSSQRLPRRANAYRLEHANHTIFDSLQWLAVARSLLWGCPVSKYPSFRAVSCSVALVCAHALASGCQNAGPSEGTASVVAADTNASPAIGAIADPAHVESVSASVADAAACSTTLVATHQYHPALTTDGTVKLSKPMPFAIPSTIPVTAGGASSAQANFIFALGTARKLTCAYQLGRGAKSLSFKACSNRDNAGAVVQADSFDVHVVSATPQTPAQSKIQITLVLDAVDGTACSGSSACFGAYACQKGVCAGAKPVACTAPDACHTVGICDPATGACSNPAAADGTACDDGNACTTQDVCTAGQCAGTPGGCGSDGGSVDATVDATDPAYADEQDSTETSDAATGAVDAAGDDAGDGPPVPLGPLSVGITWASIANVYLEFGSTSMLIDGYITRLPGSDFFGGGGGLAFTHSNFSSDETAIGDVLAALGGPPRINWLFTGHSHWDHSFDTATWARLTGAPIYGPRTTCFEARAEGTPVAGCTAVVGGEKLQIAPGVTVRVVRWNHSGDATSNPEQHDPVELPAVPTPDAQGRLRAGVAEDFPNGGGSRGFLFTIDSAAGAYSFFFEDTAGAGDLTQPVVVDGVNYGAPLSNLAAAFADASLTHVDLWIGTGGAPVAQLVVPLLHPKAYLPVHWDGLFRAFRAGAPAFSDSGLSNYLGSRGVRLVTPLQYMDKWSLSPSGIVPVDNKQVKQALGF